MAAPFMTSKTPTVDSGLGLIFRLNNLWVRADEAHLSGKIDHWNFILDAIYDNLSYNCDVQLDKDDHGRIIGLKFSADHEDIYNYLNKEIFRYKADMKDAIKRKKKDDYTIAKNKLFTSIRSKDKYLRTFMYKLNLYLKQYETHMDKSMFGGA